MNFTKRFVLWLMAVLCAGQALAVNTYPTGDVIVYGTATIGSVIAGADTISTFLSPTGTGHSQAAISENNFSCNITNGSANVVLASGSLPAYVIAGWTVTGNGIPLNTTINTVTDTTHFVMSANATATTNGLNVDLGPYVAINPATCVGYDFGASNQVLLKSWRFVPQITQSSYGGNLYTALYGTLSGGTLAVGTSSVIDAIPQGAIPNRFGWNERPLTVAYGTVGNVSKFRSFGIGNVQNYIWMSRLQFIADPAFFVDTGSKINCMPMEPTFEPNGGRFPNSATPTVSLRCRTTSAAIVYTTDGTTPAVTGSGSSGSHWVLSGTTQLYTKGSLPQYIDGSATGAFTVTPTSGGMTIQAMALDANATTTASQIWTSAPFLNYGFKPQTVWRDTEGVIIEARSPSVFYDNGRYWIYGQWANAYAGYPGGDIGCYNGIRCYSSTDLVNLENYGRILDDLGAKYMLRPAVLKCPTTGLYVMMAKCSTSVTNSSNQGLVFATAPSPGGPWKYATRPTIYFYDGTTVYTNGDCTLFQDTNGTGWGAFQVNNSSAVDRGIYIAQLNTDYIGFQNSPILLPSSTGQEGPQLFKQGNTYFAITGGSNYYDSVGQHINPQWWYNNTGTSPITGTWNGPYNLFASDPFGTTNYNPSLNFQPSCVLNVNGQWMVFGDYWSVDLYHSTQFALPLQFPTAISMKIGMNADAGTENVYQSGWYPKAVGAPKPFFPPIRRSGLDRRLPWEFAGNDGASLSEIVRADGLARQSANSVAHLLETR